jgi:folate-binding protein YgfZ
MKMSGSYIDVSERALLQLDGGDALDLLQRISTNHLLDLTVGEHAQTVLTTEKGRIVDVISVFRRSDSSLVLAGQTKGEVRLSEWINRYVVMEDVTALALTRRWTQILLFGFQLEELNLVKTNANCLLGRVEHRDASEAILLADGSERMGVEEFLRSSEISRATPEEWERYRVMHSLPGYPNELNDQFNPLELGLEGLISFSKGCYVGQEVIARLDTYDKVRRSIRRFKLSAEPSKIPMELKVPTAETAGTLTSFARTDDSDCPIVGMGVVRNDTLGKEFIYSTRAGDSSGRALLLDN